MKCLFRLAAVAAAGVTLTCLASCGVEDITLAGHDLGPVIGEHAHSVQINLGDVASRWLLPASALHNAAVGFAGSAIWKEVKDDLDGPDEALGGPVRDALVEAACDSVQNGQYNYFAYQANLGDAFRNSAVHIFEPITPQLIGVVSDLAMTLSADAAEDSSAKATVAIGCAAYSSHSLFNRP